MKDIVVTAADISLFHVAARELGDACQWWRIAQSNGLSDPDLSRIETVQPLKIPVEDLTFSSGLPDEAGG
ncbi:MULTISPECIES: hypothetical protein [unclassified Gluconobacter]|uniref:hypothetical protein n=1 Tax=unclassified Gluconobacter TaxID=2644261 RepID=UPI001C04BC81|nr:MULTISPECIES: hypothetical protein [unclassified Gluconobacter]